MIGVHPQMTQHRLQLVEQALRRGVVARRIREPDVPVLGERHAILRVRQILGREPEVDRVARDVTQGETGRELRLHGLLPLEHVGRRLPDHLHVPQRVVDVLALEIEVVHAQGLLEDGGVGLLRQGEDRLAVVEHVVPSDLVGSVGQAVRMAVVRRCQQQLRRVRRSARDDHDVGRERLRLALSFDDHAGDRPARGVGLEAHGPGVGHQGDVRLLESGSDAEHLRVRLGVHEAGEPIARAASDARAERHIRFVQHHAARGVERVVARCREVVGQLLDPRLVRQRRERVGPARRGLGRDPRPSRRAPGSAAPRACSRAPSRRSRSATPARPRRDASARRSPRPARR